MGYIGCHQHTVYSFLDGYCKIPDLVTKSKELGWTATAITDHNSLAGCYTFKQECEKQGIKPLLGLEGYYTPSIHEMMKPVDQRNKEAEENAIACEAYTREQISAMKKEELKSIHHDYGYDMDDFHILFIAKSQKGWHNLIKIQSESARLCTFNGRFHCDMNLLEKYHEDVICSTACIGSYPAQQIKNQCPEMADEYLDRMLEIFGKDFYLEIQPLNQKLQRETNLHYMKWAADNGVKFIATNDSHWVNQVDAADHDILLCIGTGAKLSDKNRMRYWPEFWIRSEDEMVEAFEKQTNEMLNRGELEENDLVDYQSFYEKALANTQELADSVDDNIRLGSPKPLFSNVKVPEGYTPESWLSRKAWKGLNNYLNKHPECDRFKYAARLKEELDVINPKGFAPYMLAVDEYVNWYDENGIATGPGRGSAAGSLVLFSIGVTKNIDPIKCKLLFGRFLTNDRTSPPDIDGDFSNLHREEVIKHLEDYYGKEKVAHIGTFGTLKVKSSVKDVARVLEVPFADSLKISKAIDAIDTDPNLTFKMVDSWKDSDEASERNKWEAFHKLEEENQRIFTYARKFEGIPRQLGVHASGVLVTPMPVDDWVPLFYKDGTAVTLYTGPQLEEANFINIW
jgi:DNA polymerase-3 subunit alpha